MIETEQRYKKTNIGCFPADWKIIKIGNYSNIDNKSLKSNTNENYTFKYISLSDIENGKINIPNKDISFKLAPSRARRIVSNGDILLSTVRPNLKAFGMLENSSEATIASTGFAIITCKQGLHAKYLLHNLFSNSLDRQFYMLVVGSNYPAINSSDVKNLKIPLPSLVEQKKIAEILSTWDEAIDKTQQLIEQLEFRKKGLMQELLTGKKRLPGFDGEWKEFELGDITKRITTKNEELNDNVITISAQRGFVRQEEYFNKRIASSVVSGYFLIRKGDFAYNKSYSNGYPMGAFKRLDELDKAVVTTLYICFSIKDNVDSDFLLNYFEGGLLVRNLSRIAQEGGRAHGLLNIGLSDFFALNLSLPPKNEQRAISNILNNIDSEIVGWNKYLEKLKIQKKGLMQQLLTGKKRVKI